MQILKSSQIAALLGGMLVLVPISLIADPDLPHWAYEGAEGPEHWSELGDEYRMCSEGKNQSPINLVSDVHSELSELEFDYYSTPLREINNGHTIQQNVEPGSFLRIPDRGVEFELKQFHFHSPSEHSVDGYFYAMEMHFVHASEDGELAVVGVMVSEGEEHPVLKKLWSFMPEKAGDTSEQPIGIEETDLLPPTRNYYTYGGSLTTPPCTEGVKWIVLKTPVEASKEQIEIFKKRVSPTTNRPIQPTNARLILDKQDN